MTFVLKILITTKTLIINEFETKTLFVKKFRFETTKTSFVTKFRFDASKKFILLFAKNFCK